MSLDERQRHRLAGGIEARTPRLAENGALDAEQRLEVCCHDRRALGRRLGFFVATRPLRNLCEAGGR